MNRAQRRKFLMGRFGGGAPEPKYNIPCPSPPRLDRHPDFSSVPLATVCESIWILVNELRNRGYPVYDFDHKNKTVQGIKIIRDKVYFMAAEEAETDGKAQSGSEENGKQAHG